MWRRPDPPRCGRSRRPFRDLPRPTGADDHATGTGGSCTVVQTAITISADGNGKWNGDPVEGMADPVSIQGREGQVVTVTVTVPDGGYIGGGLATDLADAQVTCN